MIVTRNKLLEIYMTLMRPNDADSEDNLPYYQQRHAEMRRASKGESKEKTWFDKMCNGDREPNAHEALFWCGASGPALILHIIRTCSFLASVYFSLFVFRFGGDLTRGIHTMVLMVISLILGTSFIMRLWVFWSKSTRLASFSRTLPLDHFFFLPLPPAMAAAILASFDFCCVFGGMVLVLCRRPKGEDSGFQIGRAHV